MFAWVRLRLRGSSVWAERWPPVGIIRGKRLCPEARRRNTHEMEPIGCGVVGCDVFDGGGHCRLSGRNARMACGILRQQLEADQRDRNRLKDVFAPLQ